MKNKTNGLAALFIFTIGFFIIAKVYAQGSVAAQTYTGSIEGAAYRIRVPANWDKETLLVYAHGYRLKSALWGDTSAEAASPSIGEDLLLAQGYAIAGSAYRDNGWAVQEGISDTLALTQFFSQTIAPPKRVILMGESMGAIVTLKSIERYPEIYQGAIPMCGTISGSSMFWDRAVAFSAAYDLTFGWPSDWGKINDVRDDLSFEQDIAPVLFPQMANSTNFGKFEFLRLVGGYPSEGFLSEVAPNDGTPWIVFNMLGVTELRAELERRTGGAVSQNANHVYMLSEADKSYLVGLGINAPDLLAKMNARTDFTVTETSQMYLRNYADFSGQITRPVLTLHAIKDGAAPVANETVYRDLVAEAGKSELLVQTYVEAIGHCTFTSDQVMATVKAMESWLKTGHRPTAQAFTVTGFLPDYVPPAWPIGFETTGHGVYLPVITK